MGNIELCITVSVCQCTTGDPERERFLLVNPLTALGMVETMVDGGFFCLDPHCRGIEFGSNVKKSVSHDVKLVNIVRKKSKQRY